MCKDDRLFLLHIADAINQIFEYTADFDRTAFMGNRLVQDAVIRQFEVIGEATKNISSDLRERNPEIPWKDLARFRDKLIHHYFGVDILAVWLSVADDLPALKQQVATLISRL